MADNNLQEKIEKLNLLLVSYRLVLSDISYNLSLSDEDSTIKNIMTQIEELEKTIHMYDRVMRLT